MKQTFQPHNRPRKRKMGFLARSSSPSGRKILRNRRRRGRARLSVQFLRFPYPRSSRLQRGWEFDLAFRTGNRLRGDLVRLLFLEVPDSPLRIGLAVGKKQGASHERNRGRRILKEGFRRLRPWMKDGFWFVASLRDQGMKANARDVYADLARLLFRSAFLLPDWPGANWDAPGEGAENP